jgi:hypothetical protein
VRAVIEISIVNASENADILLWKLFFINFIFFPFIFFVFQKYKHINYITFFKNCQCFLLFVSFFKLC